MHLALRLECGRWEAGRDRVPVWECSRGSMWDSEGLSLRSVETGRSPKVTV